MKIVVIGGTGLIGSKLVNKLKEKGHDAIAASSSTGVNILTGAGLKEALKGANVVVDVSNSPSFEDKAVLDFFETSNRNILEAEKETGVKYHIALSVVGTDLIPDSGYFRAKIAQEQLIRSSHIPYTIVRATQFFEFLSGIAQSGAEGNSIRVPTAYLQPIAAEDVATALAQIVLEKPVNGIIEIAGPERLHFAEILKKYFIATKDDRTIVSDKNANYFGSKISETTLVPVGDVRLGKTNFQTWFQSQKK